jgi:peptidylprolyl isomerase
MLKKNDFIEVDYTAIVENTQQILETTSEKIAKENNVQDPKHKAKSKIICIGQQQLPPSLEEKLKSKELNKEHKITLSPENAFGKKNPKLLQLISTSNFKKQNITPYPGLHVNIDNMVGIIRTSSPGRVIVDFNHPLAGKTITYKIKILREIKKTNEKILALLDLYHVHNANIEIENSSLKIKTKIEEEKQNEIAKKIQELVPIIKKINFLKE